MKLACAPTNDFLLHFIFFNQIDMTEDKFLALCNWIDQQIDRSISWTELSEYSGADHVELQAAFAKYKSTTPMTWIRKRRQELSLKVKFNPTTVSLPPFLFK